MNKSIDEVNNTTCWCYIHMYVMSLITFFWFHLALIHRSQVSIDVKNKSSRSSICWQIGCQIPYGKKMWKQYLMVSAFPYFCSSKGLGNQIIRIEQPAADTVQEMYLLWLMSCENHAGPTGVNQTFRAVAYNALQSLEEISFWTSKKKIEKLQV